MCSRLLLIALTTLMAISLPAAGKSPDSHTHFCQMGRDVCILVGTDASVDEANTIQVTITGAIYYRHKPTYQPKPIVESINVNHDSEVYFHPAHHLTEDEAHQIDLFITKINNKPLAQPCRLSVHAPWQPYTYRLMVHKNGDGFQCYEIP